MYILGEDMRSEKDLAILEMRYTSIRQPNKVADILRRMKGHQSGTAQHERSRMPFFLLTDLLCHLAGRFSMTSLAAEDDIDDCNV